MDTTRGPNSFWVDPKANYERVLQGISELDDYDQTILSAAEVNADRLELVQAIFSDFAVLGAILEHYETTIHKRWLKKTKEQRRVVMQEAWREEMAQGHRPDWNALQKYKQTKEIDMPKVMAALMLPHINQEDLVKPRSLLLFLASRSRTHPSEFAAADLEAMRLGRSLKILSLGRLPHHAMMFTGRKDVDRYGELVRVDAFPAHKERPQVDRGVSVSDGILVLRAQFETMKFLQNCCHLILGDISEDVIPRSPALPPPTLSAGAGAGFVSLEIMAAEAPYRVPAHIDFDRMISLLGAKRDQVLDHLCSLREDPAYFQEYILDFSQHRPGAIGTECGPSVSNMMSIKWNKDLPNMITIEYMQLELFSELHFQAEALQQMCRSNAASIQPDRDLPDAYLNALLKFRYYLNEAIILVLQNKFHVFSSPPWREHINFVEQGSLLGSAVIELREPCQLDEAQMRLWDYLGRFIAYRPRYSGNKEPTDAGMLQLKILGTTTMIDELQHHIESEPRAKSMITPFIASSVGDLAIVSESLHQLEIYQPWASTFDTKMTADQVKSFQEDFQAHIMATEVRLIRVLMHSGNFLERLGAPTEGKFSYPIAERRTEGVVTALRKAEDNLDAFWKQVNAKVLKVLGPVKKTAIHRFLTQPHTLQRTSPWVEPSKIILSEGAKSLHVPFAELELNRRRLTEQTTTKEEPTTKLKPKPKTKVKTRPVAAAVGPQINDQDADEPGTHDDTTTFAVDARALKVFKTIFFTPSISATPGDIKWTDFLHAMTSTGFTPEKLYGSVWHFSPIRVELKRSINFHEPHKDGKAADKIPYCIARRIGRRLNRAYGWEGSSFSLAGK